MYYILGSIMCINAIPQFQNHVYSFNTGVWVKFAKKNFNS